MPLVSLVLKGLRVHLDQEVFLVALVLVVLRETLAQRDLKVPAEIRDPWVTQESPVLLEEGD